MGLLFLWGVMGSWAGMQDATQIGFWSSLYTSLVVNNACWGKITHLDVLPVGDVGMKFVVEW